MNLDSGQTEHYTILGAWDSDPEKHIISYLAPVAQKLLNKKSGEEVELDAESGTRRCRIESIEALQGIPAPETANA
jgi:transcription elongation GreA/GreB family factor